MSLRLKWYIFFQFYFQIHPWLPIINGVKQEKDEMKMVEKRKEDRVDRESAKENKVEAKKAEENEKE